MLKSRFDVPPDVNSALALTKNFLLFLTFDDIADSTTNDCR